ncbi:MAG: EpsG family protein [Epulopiscium sp.]|nr:EpsG family protein [Candidatus Epulonipiscium sp.]
MWPYFFIVFSILLLQIEFSKKNTNKIRYSLAFLLLFSFAALRGNGNGDYFSYLKYSTFITSIDNVLNSNFPMEIGFRIISYVVNKLGIHQQAVIVIMNLISLICIYKFIENYSPDKILSILFFLPIYFQFDMHAARTAVAIGISTFSFKYLHQRKPLKYLLVILLASFFHKTAMILIIMYFVGNIKINRYLGLMSILGASLLTKFVSFSSVILHMLKFFRLNSFAHRYYIYTQSQAYGYSYKLYDPRLFLVIGIYTLAKILLDNSDELQNLLINYIWMNALLMIIFSEHTVFVTRLTCYFNIYTIILIPYIISNHRIISNRTLYNLTKLSYIYIYISYILALLSGAVEYKLFFI